VATLTSISVGTSSYGWENRVKRTKQELQELVDELVKLKDAEREAIKEAVNQEAANNAKTGSQAPYIPRTGQ